MAYTFKYGDRPLEGVTIQRAVGRGGFGEVYYALLDSGKQVAVKYLKDNSDIELRGIAHVLNLKSPHLITVYDVKRSSEGEPFVLMEYISGPSLREIMLAEPHGMAPEKAAFFAGQIAKGLAYLHERGIVHRDLKPANIFYDDGYVKIGDYGLSKHMSVSRHSNQTVSVGTMHYMAPEIGSGSYTKAIDIYALGVMLFEMLTGRLPFTGASMAEILMKHVRDRPELGMLREPFRGVIGRALEKEPGARYQDVNEMIDALMASGEISSGVASFDPSQLTQVPRNADATDPDRTRTGAGQRVDLDARGVGLPPIPPLPPLPGEKRRGWWGRKADKPDPELLRDLKSAGRSLKSKSAHVIAVILTTVAIGVLGGVLLGRTDADEIAGASVAFSMFMLAGLFGPYLAHFTLLRRVYVRHPLLDRVVYAATTLAFGFPALLIMGGEISQSAMRAMCGAVVAMVITHWGQRIEAGRRGRVDGSLAVTPAIAGLIASAILDAGSRSIFGAGMAAALAMLTQMLSAIRPLDDTDFDPDQALRKAADKYDRPKPTLAASDHIAPLAKDGGFVFQAEVGLGQTPTPPPAPAAAAAGVSVAEAVSQRTVKVVPAEPSFVGRAANAGLAFMAKVILLVAMTWAVLFHGSMMFQDGGKEIDVRGDGVTVREGDKILVDKKVPRLAVLIPVVIGTLLLMHARRQDGASHVMRAALGGGLAIVSALVLVGPAASGLQMLFSERWDGLRDDDVGMLVLGGATLFGALGMLFWPHQRTKTIVI